MPGSPTVASSTVAPMTVLAALASSLAADPGRPLLTFYDASTQERIELSVKTFDNWVCKLANLFGDELMLDAGSRVAIELPAHWLAPVVAVGAWRAGLVVTGPGRDADARVVGPAALGDATSVQGQVIACSLRTMGGRFTEPLPAGWLDFAVEVPPQPDGVLAPVAVGPQDVALDIAPDLLTHGDLVHLGLSAAREIGLRAGGRLATDHDPVASQTMATALLAPLATESSVVLVVNAEESRRENIAAQERATCRSWSSA